MNRIMKGTFLVAASVIVLGGLQAKPASAGTATANVSITATIAANCTISTAPVAFGTYDPVVTNLSTALNGTGTITTTCTTGAAPVITLDQGANPTGGSSPTVPARQMASGSDRLAYFLYQNVGRTTVWGNTAGTAPASVAGTGAAQNVTVYGAVTGGQNVPTGSYADTVVATVSF
jgi:spore coat protein U-like protein